MSMQGCADTHIGDVLSRGISGGQAKRTNIGIALISKYGSARFRNAALMHDNRRAQCLGRSPRLSTGSDMA